MRDILLALVNSDGSCRRRPRSELLHRAPPGSREAGRQLIDRLVERRVIVAMQDDERDDARSGWCSRLVLWPEFCVGSALAAPRQRAAPRQGNRTASQPVPRSFGEPGTKSGPPIDERYIICEWQRIDPGADASAIDYLAGLLAVLHQREAIIEIDRAEAMELEQDEQGRRRPVDRRVRSSMQGDELIAPVIDPTEEEVSSRVDGLDRNRGRLGEIHQGKPLGLRTAEPDQIDVLGRPHGSEPCRRRGPPDQQPLTGETVTGQRKEPLDPRSVET